LFARAPEGVARELSWISNPDCAIAQVSAAADLSSSLRANGSRQCASSVGLAKRICFLATLVALTAKC
jgi:hypothetical protein